MSGGADGGTGGEEEHAAFLLDLLAGKCRAQAVSTAAALGIPDRLAQGPKSAAELAHELGCDVDAIERLLQLLAGLGLCDAPDANRFALTRRGEALCSDALGPLATFVGAPEQWDPWSRLRDAVREGGAVAFEQVHGTDLYEFLAHDDAASQRYDEAVDAFTRHEARALSRAFDFAAVGKVVDVGGGPGTLLLEVMARWPHLQGVLLDLPHVIERARPRLVGEVAGRLECVSGDFHQMVPEGADVYVLKHVLHNWDDDTAQALLARCAEARADGGHVLVIDAILAPDSRPDTARLLDLEMLVLTGGKERRKPELRRLFRAAGLSLERVEPLTPASWLLVGG